MGKTKLNIIAGEPEAKGKKKLSYEEKRAARAKEQSGSQVSGVGTTENQANQPETRDPRPETQIASPVKIQREGESKEQKGEKIKEHGKKYLEARKKVELGKAYPISEAVKLVRETSYSKFPGSVELHLVLDRDNVNQSLELPHSTGISRKVEVAGEDTVKKLTEGKIDFDVLIAAPKTMALLVPFAKLLGPRGLMPNPKNGTLVDDPKKAEGNFGGNNIQIKTEKSAPLIHTVVAKTTQSEKEIEENTKAILEAVGTKSVLKAVISASMGPGIQVMVK